MIDQRCIEVGTGLGHDLFTEFGAQRLRLDLLDLAVIEVAQLERPECHTDQTVYLQIERLQNFADFAVFALANTDREPDIGALFAIERGLDRSIVHARDGDTGA